MKQNSLTNQRNSNLEALRIITMCFIIAHHYVVNSGVTGCYDYDNITANMVFLQLFGMWGKTGINVFILISGYFMCMSDLTWKRFIKLLLPWKVYRILIFVILAFAGYQAVTAGQIFVMLFEYLYSWNSGFIGGFMFFYLFIPFYNKLIRAITKKQLACLIAALLLMYTVAGTFFFNANAFTYVGWYMTLYFIAAYIRMYPNKYFQRKNGGVLAITIILSWLSIICIDFLPGKLGLTTDLCSYYYYFVSDSHKIMALAVSISVFLFFKNMKPKYNRAVNSVAATAFGVLLIHANSDAMRTFLWQDLLDVAGMYTASTPILIVHAFASVIGIFVICSAIDQLRIHLLEKPFFGFLDRKTDKLSGPVFGMRINDGR